MAAVANPVVTEAEYLALAERSDVKLEFVGGQVRMMAGGSLEHAAIMYRIGLALGPLADARGCQGFTSEARLKVKADGQYVYPDLSFVCQKAEREGLSLLNPTLLVEVLSPGTAEYDRTEKLDLYQAIASLEEYVMVHSDEPRVERYRRHGQVWLYESVRGLGASIEVLGGTVELAGLYRGVDFSPR